MAPSPGHTVLGPTIRDSSSGGLEWSVASELLKSLPVTAWSGLGAQAYKVGQDNNIRRERKR